MMKVILSKEKEIIIENKDFFIIMEEDRFILSRAIDKNCGELVSQVPKYCIPIYEDKSIPRYLYKDNTHLYEVIGNRAIIRYSI